MASTHSGLWPLLLDSLNLNDGEFHPWGSGEVFPEQISSPASHASAGLLAQWWATYTAVDEDDILDTDRRLAVTAPFGQTWPGLAPSRETTTNPDQLASEFADAFLAEHPQARLGLVAAASSAEALTAAGWAGPALRQRHREVLHGRPAGERKAPLVAAEHLAFYPDNNIWQGSRPYTLAACAERITGARRWDFWWD
ncbi:DUF4253 domain-containing protein [Streptomyces rochei]|uniref:DUF4253 domain-containing protein n=1 Tax=Streptomyces rochei TaxID=1928 RepID=UPI0036A118C3